MTPIQLTPWSIFYACASLQGAFLTAVLLTVKKGNRTANKLLALLTLLLTLYLTDIFLGKSGFFYNPSTTIRYDLAQVVKISLKIFDSGGREIRTLAAGRQSAGTHSLVWDGRNEKGEPVASGVYLYRLRAGSSIAARKMLLVK
ncbi:MAG: T9SS type A sorting domain-containing protein [Calditrichaeota bacterium]|nr:T9SS type A sorting domain-containing protein [Calditrichota bacterium]MCB0291982.1 T9SS type A sorting domain-containing protein [Calditrichota bacterium]MCB0303414.1 T9SS type A sorting domain-containing protein [Calditrichota bacterium]MCB0312740.1 T9SS type A sorting domain-containing protein [Calditrichota bacterium]MCB9089375.1 T9SS type A sorting domain-containing protein [Calditrichia bacterium]